jgi:hypothetical protein
MNYIRAKIGYALYATFATKWAPQDITRLMMQKACLLNSQQQKIIPRLLCKKWEERARSSVKMYCSVYPLSSKWKSVQWVEHERRIKILIT